MSNPSCTQKHRDLRERLLPAVPCLPHAADGSCVGAELLPPPVTLPGATSASCETAIPAHRYKLGLCKVNIFQTGV